MNKLLSRLLNDIIKIIFLFICIIFVLWIFVGLPLHIIGSEHIFFVTIRTFYLIIWNIIMELEKDNKILSFILGIIFIGLHWLIIYILGNLIKIFKPLIFMIKDLLNDLNEFIDQVFPKK